ncbi:restriction endonuclease subunit S [Helicobacter pylori]|uniref:restriction endonuclease subunit S n=1 Tax=Helicobacter pylori TaxID=210 RepID=UPI0011197910|nr:restriction endonuclease subunit S [Helicobacter pylori]
MTRLLDLKNNSVIAINQNNYTKEDNYKKVCYLDTDNITNNRRNFYVTHYDGKFDAYQRTYVVNPNNPNHYVLIYLFVKSYTNYLKLQSRGSIIKFITKSDIENIKIVLPNLKTYTKWNNVLKIIENNNQSTQTLTAFRDFLLPLLLKQQVKPQ